MSNFSFRSFVFVFVASFGVVLSVSGWADDRPNVVLILADDLGYGDVGFNGCADIPTPNIDLLAAEGVRFSNGYSSHPFCSPMRAGLMAGRYQHRFGYVTNVAFDPHNQVMGIPESEKTIASRLRDAGYRTGMVGKWHLGASSPFHPMNRGFDFFYGFLGGGHDYFIVDTRVQLRENYKAALDDNGKPTAFEGYLTTVLTDEAIGFMRQENEKPYFLYVAYNAPHGPLQAPEDEIAKFESIQNPKRRTYAAMVSVMDQQIGRLIHTIDDLGQREKTLIAFLSDNGGPEQANASDNGPLRGSKGDVFEGGVHVPFVMRMPGTLPAGKVYDAPVISFDISQTALALAGAKEAGAKDATDQDGVDLFPYVLGDILGQPHDALFWRTAGDAKRAVRRGFDKLVLMNDESMLFDLESDLGEANNRAGSDQETVADLSESWDRWNQTNEPARFPGYRDYHERLKAFHQSVREDAQREDER